jgi:hypothetical protein
VVADGGEVCNRKKWNAIQKNNFVLKNEICTGLPMPGWQARTMG